MFLHPRLVPLNGLYRSLSGTSWICLTLIRSFFWAGQQLCALPAGLPSIVRLLCEGSYCEAHMWRILLWGSYVKDLIEGRLICEGSYCEAHMWRIVLWSSYVKDPHCEAHMWRILLWGSYVKDPIVGLICEGSYCEAHMWRILLWGTYVKDPIVRVICEGS